MSATITSAKSGIQKEVFALYRNILREAIKKDRSSIVGTHDDTVGTSDVSGGNNNAGTSLHTRPTAVLLRDKDSMTAHARYEFRKQASQINRKDFRTIEYKIRHGYKQIKLLQMPGVKKFNTTSNIGGVGDSVTGPGGNPQG